MRLPTPRALIGPAGRKVCGALTISVKKYAGIVLHGESLSLKGPTERSYFAISPGSLGDGCGVACFRSEGAPRGTPQVLDRRSLCMCRNIKNLFNFDPPVTDEEIRNASLQFVRKISGFNKPSKANEAGFVAAIDEVARASARLLRSLETNAPPKNREEEAEKLKARAAERFGD
jgi:hypothetical protein